MEATTHKCRCRHCDARIEFESSQAGQLAECPNCGLETLLFIALPPRSAQKIKRKSLPVSIWVICGALALAFIVAIPEWDSQTEYYEYWRRVVATFFGLVGVLIAIAIYLIPTLVAHNRRHKNLLAIFMTNLLFGWVFVGWAVALIWAVKKE